MAKYTDARFPDKINDLVDNDGNVNITQKPWCPWKLRYSSEDFDYLYEHPEDTELVDAIESNMREFLQDSVWDSYIEFSTTDDYIIKGATFNEDLGVTNLGYLLTEKALFILSWAMIIDTETGSWQLSFGGVEQKYEKDE